MIWLLRHGEAEDGSPDAERKLTEKGERQSRVAGLALKKLGVGLDACLSSPKVRAADTAKLACEELGAEVQMARSTRTSSRLDWGTRCCSWGTTRTSRWRFTRSPGHRCG